MVISKGAVCMGKRGEQRLEGRRRSSSVALLTFIVIIYKQNNGLPLGTNGKETHFSVLLVLLNPF